jgi:hypothetical protein
VIAAFGFIVTPRCADTVPPQPPVIVYIILHDPTDTPVTNPDALTVATNVLLLLHAPVPPLKTIPFAVYVAVLVIQSGLVPVTDATLALAFIVIDCSAVFVPPQPPVIVYTILHVPTATPVTNPVDELTVATAVLLLLQDPVPPPNTTPVAVYVAVPPMHNGLVPVTDVTFAVGVTVTVCVVVTGPPHPAALAVIVVVPLHVDE